MFRNMTNNSRPVSVMRFDDSLMWHRSVMRLVDIASDLMVSVLPERNYHKLAYMTPANYGRDYAREEAERKEEEEYWDRMDAED